MLTVDEVRKAAEPYCDFKKPPWFDSLLDTYVSFFLQNDGYNLFKHAATNVRIKVHGSINNLTFILVRTLFFFT